MEMTKIRTNPGPATSAYKDLVTKMPKQEDFAPSKMTRLGASLTGLAAGMKDPAEGPAAARSIIRAPYEDAVREYGMKLGASKTSADLEREDMRDQLSALAQARAMGLKLSEFQHKQLMDRADLKVKQDRAAAYIKKQGDPSYDHFPQADGSILAVNKTNPADRKTIPANTVQAAVLKTRQEANAIAGRNASTNEANSKSLAAYRTVMGDAATKRATASVDRLNKPVTPYQQAKAVDLALSLMFRDRRFSKYIKAGDASSPEPYLMQPDDGSPLYKEFRKELKRQVEQSIKKGDPFTEEEENADDDDIIVH
jgi:hypothetical protein